MKMFDKIMNFLLDLGGALAVIVVVIAALMVAVIAGSPVAIVAAIVGIIGILLKLLTTLLTKTSDRVASIYLWVLQNFREFKASF